MYTEKCPTLGPASPAKPLGFAREGRHAVDRCINTAMICMQCIGFWISLSRYMIILCPGSWQGRMLLSSIVEISSSMIQCHSIFAPGEGQIICLTPPCAGGGGCWWHYWGLEGWVEPDNNWQWPKIYLSGTLIVIIDHRLSSGSRIPHMEACGAEVCRARVRMEFNFGIPET